MTRARQLLLVGVLALCGCTFGSGSAPSAPWVRPASRLTASSSPIQHVVIVIQENRSFNDFFATFPGADGSTVGKAKKNPKCDISQDETVQLTEGNLIIPYDFKHSFQAFRTERDNGNMDGFDVVTAQNGQPECLTPYQYVNPAQIAPYWDIAKSYVLAEHMFSTQGSGSFTAHQDLIAAGTVVAPQQALVNLPTCPQGDCRWGCDAPKNTRTSLITQGDVLESGQGPFPCSKDFAIKYPTLRDLLDAKSVSWKYYVPSPCCNTNGRLYTAFDVIAGVRYGPEWKTNISRPQTNIFNDITDGALPAVSWLIPDEPDSDHPGEKRDEGPAWVASVVNAIGESPYWDSTAIIIVWDEWGGLYDNYVPKKVGYGGLGFRVPALIVSAYSKPGYISTTEYQFASILKYIENNWHLGSLGGNDKYANSIINCFNYSHKPLKFVEIPSDHDKEFFVHQKPSGLPPDDDM
jgi:phospholipase C